ncbi:MAG: hypothetical protein J5674_01910, partial [Candidatus Methanomethylophilaceae archaeon]|nr:hypothetical protein [Candidatus Methanomethylophilaceae archaeon]
MPVVISETSSELENRRYGPPSDVSQAWCCFLNQMSLFSRRKAIWALFLSIPAMPALYIAFETAMPGLFLDSETTDVRASCILAALPLASMLAASVVCGSAVSAERSEMTEYITLALPVSRSAAFVGRLAAGMAVCSALVLAAYGTATAMAMLESSQTCTPVLLESLAVSLAGTFFFCSFAGLIGARVRRGSSVLPLALLAAAIPLFCILASIAVPS